MTALVAAENLLDGVYTDDYSRYFVSQFKNIEDIDYYIHDEFTLLESSTSTYSWEHWEGHEAFIEDAFRDLDKYIDLDFERVYEKDKAHIEIYRYSSLSVYADLGFLGIALGSNSQIYKDLFPYAPERKEFGLYQSAFWTSADQSSPFVSEYSILKHKDAHTIIHEIGHALGLSHPQSSPGVDDPHGLWHDSKDTVMSYNDKPVYDRHGYFAEPIFWSPSDIEALQLLWGEEDDYYKITHTVGKIAFQNIQVWSLRRLNRWWQSNQNHQWRQTNP